jgi:hypothetical protein
MAHLTKGTIVLMEDYPESRFEIIRAERTDDGYVYDLEDLNGIEDILMELTDEEFELEDEEDDVEDDDD